MAIVVVSRDGLYDVSVSPPHGAPWAASGITATEVLERVSDLGCHSTDITDALYAADPSWPERHDAEVARRRSEA